ncbi:MAG: hypothetical protein JWO45_1793, partial [Spartobacteria bacterium]|nr:hypothetical protein [Spartobacteria bacterium]
MSILRAGNKKWAFLIILVGATMTATAAVDLGIDVLQQSNYAILKDKRVGLITNHTGVNSQGVRTRVLLRQH